MTSRRKKPLSRSKGGEILGPDTEAWVRLKWGDVILLHGEEATEEGEVLPENYAILLRPRMKPYPTRIPLSEMTRDELWAFKELIEEALKQAEPLCIKYDLAAQKAWEEHGDDSFDRLYRPIPKITRRRGGKPKHDASVPSGPDETPEGDGTAE